MSTAEIVQGLVDGGMDRGDAQLVTDLAKHACGEAVDTMKRVTGNAPTRQLSSQAYLVALQFMAVNLTIAVEELAASQGKVWR